MEIKIEKLRNDGASITLPDIAAQADETSAAAPFIFGLVVGMFVPIGSVALFKEHCTETLHLLGFALMMLSAWLILFVSWIVFCSKQARNKVRLTEALIEERSVYVRSLIEKLFGKELPEGPLPVALTIKKENCQSTDGDTRIDKPSYNLSRGESLSSDLKLETES